MLLLPRFRQPPTRAGPPELGPLYLEAGETLEEFLKQFPTVTRRQVLDVLEAARTRAGAEAVPA